jgi:hypothetical protein
MSVTMTCRMLLCLAGASSSLRISHLISDGPGHPTRRVLDDLLAFLQQRLISSRTGVAHG